MTNGAYVCQCKPETNSKGQNCNSCEPGFFREATDFSCPHQCSCSPSGVVDGIDICEEVRKKVN